MRTSLKIHMLSNRVMKLRNNLDSCLSRALGVPLVQGRLKLIDDSDYVLTLDFASKMLNIHERRKCGIPVIIEGETGVGKTALIQMLSKLWNYKYAYELSLLKERVLDMIQKGKCIILMNLLAYLSCTEL